MTDAGHTLRVALVTMISRVGDTQDNALRHHAWMQQAVDLGAHVVLFPECSLTGYGGPPSTAIPLDSSFMRSIGDCAADVGAHAFVGFAERSGDSIYSSCALVGPLGMQGVMRKINCIPEESGTYAAGRDFTLFTIGGRTLGVAICSNSSVYEVPKILALRGAELVLCPHANGHSGLRGSPQRWQRWRHSTWQRFVTDCGVYMLGSNVAHDPDGPALGGERQYCGGSLAVDPYGELIAESDRSEPDENLILVDVPVCGNPAAELFGCLRPEILYGRTGWAFGQRTGDGAAAQAAACGSIGRDEPSTSAERSVPEPSLPLPASADSDPRISFYCSAALAFHDVSSIGRYPLPPVSLRTSSADTPRIDVASGETDRHAAQTALLGRMSLADALEQRRSRRHFGRAPLAREHLASILWAAYGRQATATAPYDVRTVPSAGGLFGLELFVVTQSVAGIAEGIYVYGPATAQLDPVEAHAVRIHRWFSADDIEYDAAAAAIVMVARLDRVAAKSGERAYRHLLLEAGHVGQNIALASTALNVACVPAGGFNDRLVSGDLNLGVSPKLPVYCVVVGSM